METRIQKLISLSKAAPYTKEELKFLYGLINDRINNTYPFNNNLFDVSESLKGEIKGEGTLIDWNSDSEDSVSFKTLNFLQFLLIYFRKIFLFLVCVPIDRVPLYIEHKELNDFAHWRLSIKK